MILALDRFFHLNLILKFLITIINFFGHFSLFKNNNEHANYYTLVSSDFTHIFNQIQISLKVYSPEILWVEKKKLLYTTRLCLHITQQ